MQFYNSLTRHNDKFEPIDKKEVRLYTCGPTVYWYAHIGNLRTYIFEDILKRVIEFNGLKVKHVMNITDVGHLTSDADSGEDKLEKGALRENKSVWDIAEFYTQAFLKDLERLNILKPDILVKATETIQEQIDLIKTLEEKGFTYKIKDGIYFDTSKLPSYGALWPNKMDLKAGARVEMVEGKKNATDFALWKLSPADSKRQMEWPSPWGIGFPGWHTECVAMAQMHLGIPFDIHCGGIDHVLIHHTNEIAQGEAAFGHNPANFWMHGEFMTIKGETDDDKISKSKGNIVLIDDLVAKKINPLSFRYLCLMTHYRQKMNYSLEALEGAQNAYYSALENIKQWMQSNQADLSSQAQKFNQEFAETINNDLDLPKALALFWTMSKSEILPNEKYQLALLWDKVFGLDFANTKIDEIPDAILKIAQKRQIARETKNWQESDSLRDELKSLGWDVKDTSAGFELKKI